MSILSRLSNKTVASIPQDIRAALESAAEKYKQIALANFERRFKCLEIDTQIRELIQDGKALDYEEDPDQVIRDLEIAGVFEQLKKIGIHGELGLDENLMSKDELSAMTKRVTNIQEARTKFRLKPGAPLIWHGL